MFSFNPLWKTLVDRNMNKSQLQEKIKCSPRTIATMAKNKYVAMSVLDKICKELNCKIEDVIMWEKSKE